MLEDKLLVWKLKQGSTDALRIIYEKHRDDLLRIAAGLLIEKTQAEDAVHDVFISLVNISQDLRLTGTLRGYLAVSVANRARNINRLASRHKTSPLDDVECFDSKAKRPDQWIIEDEQFSDLRLALNQLAYKQREAVVLHLHGKLKFRQIAKLQDVSVQTIQSRYRYGLNKLRSILKSRCQNEIGRQNRKIHTECKDKIKS